MKPLGHARFDYRRGWWDEFRCDADKEMLCVCLDDGGIAIERAWGAPSGQKFRPEIGATLDVAVAGQRFTVAGYSKATCTAIRGEFGEVMSIDEIHDKIAVAHAPT